MGGTFKKVTKEINRFGAKNVVGDAMGSDFHKYAPIGSQGREKYDLQKYAGKAGYDSDSDIIAGNPTTPLSKSDSMTKTNDPLDLFGEQEADAVKNAEEEAKANYRPPTAIPDEDEIKRVQRRRSSRRRGRGRSSTVLSDYAPRDEGLGG